MRVYFVSLMTDCPCVYEHAFNDVEATGYEHDRQSAYDECRVDGGAHPRAMLHALRVRNMERGPA